MSSYPSELKYTKDHEWARVEGELIQIGITEYAVQQLGDVTLVDLPSVGASVSAGERFGDIESVKTVSELFAPVSGDIAEINSGLEDRPELVNESPYSGGWMVRIRGTKPAELERLMDASAYAEYVKSLDG